jgi:hypothetical protein
MELHLPTLVVKESSRQIAALCSVASTLSADVGEGGPDKSEAHTDSGQSNKKNASAIISVKKQDWPWLKNTIVEVEAKCLKNI